MKTNRFIRLIQAAGCLAFFTLSGYAAGETAPTNAVITITVTDTEPGPDGTYAQTVTVQPLGNSARWEDIKNLSYDRRGAFVAGLQRLETKLSDQHTELNAQRSEIKDPLAINNWDFALMQWERSRSSFQSLRETVVKATPATWKEKKEKIGQAWAQTQNTYGKLKSTLPDPVARPTGVADSRAKYR